MASKQLKSEQSKAGRVKAGLGAVFALAGLMTVQASVNSASALTLNGEFFFAPFESKTNVPLVTFVGPDLEHATSVTFATPQGGIATPTKAKPFVQLIVNGIPATYNGKLNDFDSTIPSPPAYAMDTGSIVSIFPLTLTPMNLNGGFFLSSLPGFLTFAGNSYLGNGNGDRFTYDVTSISWTSNSLNHLDIDFRGFVSDSVGFFDDHPAEVHLALVSGCELAPSSCKFANAAGTFESDGTGGNELIPEPISLSLLGVGLTGLAIARRRRS